MPIIYDGSSIIQLGGTTAVQFSQTAQTELSTINSTLFTDGSATSIIVYNRNGGSGSQTVWNLEAGGQIARYTYGTTGDLYLWYSQSGQVTPVGTYPIGISPQEIIGAGRGPTDAYLYRNAVLQQSLTADIVATPKNTAAYIGSRAGGQQWPEAQIQEIIHYGFDNSANRLNVESNANSYYQITNLPDYTSGFLADYSGTAAAYSVRKLSNTAIKCMRVRRTVAPFDEQDIGFTPAGDLDTAAISTFGGSDPLTVSRWYDQSGFSRHAVQNTPGSQPQIYNGTAVITKGGRPALEWDFSNDENFDIVGLTMTSKTVAIVFERLNNTSRALSSYAGSGSLGDEILIDRNGTNVRYFDGGLSVSATGATANRTLIYAYRNASSIGVAFDGGTYATASTPNSNANTNDISIGEDNGGGAAEPPGYHQEVILWSSDYSRDEYQRLLLRVQYERVCCRLPRGCGCIFCEAVGQQTTLRYAS
jgi:hypothetical protein